MCSVVLGTSFQKGTVARFFRIWQEKPFWACLIVESWRVPFNIRPVAWCVRSQGSSAPVRDLRVTALPHTSPGWKLVGLLVAEMFQPTEHVQKAFGPTGHRKAMLFHAMFSIHYIIYMYIHVYVYVCMCIYIYIHGAASVSRMYIYIYTHIFIYTCRYNMLLSSVSLSSKRASLNLPYCALLPGW